MYCSKCGANVADGTAFCSACGQPMVGFSVGQAAPANPAAPQRQQTVYAPPAQAGWQAPAARPAVAYAGFWLRFVAFIIDQLLLYFVGMILFLPFAASMGMRGMMRWAARGTSEALFPMIHAMAPAALLRLVIHWLYYSLLESSAWQGHAGQKGAGPGSHGPGRKPH